MGKYQFRIGNEKVSYITNLEEKLRRWMECGLQRIRRKNDIQKGGLCWVFG